MKKFMIITGTITYALKGRDLLRKKGFKARVERSAPVNEGYGCGYVIISEGDINAIKEILDSNRIKILKILDLK